MSAKVGNDFLKRDESQTDEQSKVTNDSNLTILENFEKISLSTSKESEALEAMGSTPQSSQSSGARRRVFSDLTSKGKCHERKFAHAQSFDVGRLEYPSEENKIWDAAKADAVHYVARKQSMDSKKTKLLHRLRRGKSMDKCTGSKSPVLLEDVHSCPLMNAPQVTPSKDRKVAVCEKTQTDRELVYHSLKYYRQQKFIDNFVLPK